MHCAVCVCKRSTDFAQQLTWWWLPAAPCCPAVCRKSGPSLSQSACPGTCRMPGTWTLSASKDNMLQITASPPFSSAHNWRESKHLTNPLAYPKILRKHPSHATQPYVSYLWFRISPGFRTAQTLAWCQLCLIRLENWSNHPCSTLMMVVAFSSRARILGECSTITPYQCFFFLLFL